MAKRRIVNSTVRNYIKPGTVIKIFDKVGVVYSDGPGEMIRINCAGHESFAFRPERLVAPVYYEIVEEHEPIALDGLRWDFVSNIQSRVS